MVRQISTRLLRRQANLKFPWVPWGTTVVQKHLSDARYAQISTLSPGANPQKSVICHELEKIENKKVSRTPLNHVTITVILLLGELIHRMLHNEICQTTPANKKIIDTSVEASVGVDDIVTKHIHNSTT